MKESLLLQKKETRGKYNIPELFAEYGSVKEKGREVIIKNYVENFL